MVCGSWGYLPRRKGLGVDLRSVPLACVPPLACGGEPADSVLPGGRKTSALAASKLPNERAHTRTRSHRKGTSKQRRQGVANPTVGGSLAYSRCTEMTGLLGATTKLRRPACSSVAFPRLIPWYQVNNIRQAGKLFAFTGYHP